MTHTIRKLAAALVLALLAPLAFAQGAFAPAMFTPFKKGGATTLTAATTATSGCTDGAFLYSLSSLLNCGAVLTTDGNTVTVNNGAAAASIFVAKDNGTAVLTVADGGATTFTGYVSHNGGATVPTNQGLDIGNVGAGGLQLSVRSAKTPDGPYLFTGTTADSVAIAQYADALFDFNNGRCGTSACTSPALIIHSPDQVTTEYAQISTDTTGAAGFQSNFAEIRVGGTKTAITESSVVAIARVGIATSTNVYGMTVFYTIYDINGANYVTRTGSVKVQGGNSGGTATCTINTTQDAETEDGSQVATSNAATLTYTWTNVVSTTNCNLSVNIASSEGANTAAITWTAVLTGNSSGITITPQ